MSGPVDPAPRPNAVRVLRFMLFAGAAVNLMFWAAHARLSPAPSDPHGG